LTLFNPDTAYPWRNLAADLGKALGAKAEATQKGNHALLVAQADEEKVLPWIRSEHPDVRIMGYGQLMEVYKDMGLPAQVAARATASRTWKAAMPSAIPAWRPKAP